MYGISKKSIKVVPKDFVKQSVSLYPLTVHLISTTSYEMELSHVSISVLCIFLVINSQGGCNGEDDLYSPTLKFMSNIPGIGDIRKAYCNSACGPARFLFSSILKTYCKLKCPNSTLANLDLDSGNTTKPFTPTMPTISIIPMFPNIPNMSSLLTTILPSTTASPPPSTTTIPSPNSTPVTTAAPITTTTPPANSTKSEANISEIGGNAVESVATPPES
ncbi:hypothetical protein QAD02_004593 [Eretmocerus hayati]|uniref:Uncharacterized protein n=1 Tax=Eretmocerus hayati TaxID=131215 RepID=A0ACC2NRU9_9HYME|nr:hypothetical protein QAD02_004593 [Eretmocerus hayati]